MYTKRYVTLMGFALLLALLFSCSKSDEPADQSVMAARRSSGAAPADEMTPPAESSSDANERDRSGPGAGVTRNVGVAREKGALGDGLDVNFLAPMDKAKGRLLEYTVSLSYETENILESRRKLLELVSRYGFITHSTAVADTRQPFVNAEVMVKTELLYEALKDFESLGLLKNENINVIDHTEGMVLNERRVQRENLRIMRRNRAMGQLTAQNKNWEAVEQNIEQSEERLDQAEHGKWQIQDKVAWVRVQVSLRGPDLPNRIDVPLYRNAFIGLLNLTLRLVYLLIWLAPFIVLGILIWRYRGRLLGILKRKA
ncbi:MAG: DUF4349 domain-containing protein [Spirochaetes bacterium]|nr:DUF4349 domain-containing protein [Spirochaetota bacterium]